MHVLATTALTLDEADVAVDLQQTPADVVVLSFSDSDLTALAAAWTAAKAELPSLRLASLKHLRHPMSVDLYIDSVVSGAKVIIVRALGGLDYWRYGFDRLADIAKSANIQLIALPGCDKPDPRLKAYASAPSAIVELFDQLFRAGGIENCTEVLRQAGALAAGNEFARQEVQKIGPVARIDHKGRIANGHDQWPELDGRPVALIIFYRAHLLAADIAPILDLTAALEAEGMMAVALAVTSLKDPAVAPVLAEAISKLKPAIILNATAFSAQRDDNTSVLDQADVPILQVVLAGTNEDAWQESDRGLSPTDIAMNVVLPEVDGRLLTRAISFKCEDEVDPDLQFAAVRHRPEQTRISFAAKLAANWVRLSMTPAPARRLALILSDYPAREGRTGYAVGLDTSASTTAIISLLREANYDVGTEDITKETLAPLLQRSGASLSVPRRSYDQAFSELPEQQQQAIADTWGSPEQDPSYRQDAFHFTVIRAGKTLIALQPDRGTEAHRKQGYHDVAIPPRHAYIAFYAWLRHQEQVDAIIHLGTHGTLEWLPGKAVALSSECFPETVLGPTPMIYPFIVNNPGEAVHAKRRLSAATIGHLTPPLTAAGLHGKLAELEGLIEEFAEADGVDRRRTELLEAEIVERAWASGLAKDCGVSPDDDPRQAITKLDAQLCDIKELAVRDRLHVFGSMPEAGACQDLTKAIAETAKLPANDVTQLISQSAASERSSLLRALDGRRVSPGPSGAPSRGRVDVLPTGRNLTTIDPRTIPTRTAAIVGARAADEVVMRYLQDYGEYPRALVLDLWASASLRTGGDDLAQAFSYLGVRPIWDHGSNRVTGVEVIPPPKISRPRIDVTVRISGLFRDIFASQIAMLELAVGLVADLDEDEQQNPLAAARRRNESLERVFGAAPGVYGAAASALALDGDWREQDDIGNAYLAGASHAYGASEAKQLAGDKFKDRIVVSDVLVHTQDDRERDLLDNDGVADFVGGYAAAAAMLGRTPALYHVDTSKPEDVRVRTIPEEITRIVRGRLTNPKWIEGMLGHGHHGAAEIAQGVDALYAFAATAQCVPSHLFDAVHEALIADQDVADRLREANPGAADAIARRLDDAIVRALWQPRRNAVGAELDRLRRAGFKGMEAAQ